MDDGEDHPVRHAPRIGHKKSRKGCLKCRSRRVKCDETHPRCKNCHRLGLQCRFPSNTEGTPPAKSSHGSPGSRSSGTSVPRLEQGLYDLESTNKFYANSAGQSDGHLGEDRARRMMELRLMQFWMSKGAEGSNYGGWRQVWMADVPGLALHHDHLLYALLSFAATQLTTYCPHDEELAAARQAYWSMALREQQVALLSGESLNREVMAFSAYLIDLNAFSMLRERVMEPYTPPHEWLSISQGSKAITPDLEDIPVDSPLRRVIEICSPLWEEHSNERGLVIDPQYQKILDSWLTPEESAPEVRRHYERALSYVSSFRKAVTENEPGYGSMRRVAMFADVVSKEFLDFVREQRPRALVVLACFFSIVGQSEAPRYLGDPDRTISKREVTGINRALPDKWKSLMTGPLDETFGRVQLFTTGP